jgi:hypothetical protein
MKKEAILTGGLVAAVWHIKHETQHHTRMKSLEKVAPTKMPLNSNLSQYLGFLAS